MALTICSKCAGQVSTLANACPRCGTPPTTPSDAASSQNPTSSPQLQARGPRSGVREPWPIKREWLVLGGIVAALAFVLVAAALADDGDVGSNLGAHNGGPGNERRSHANIQSSGPPFSANAQESLRYARAVMGADFAIDDSVGRCEVLWQFSRTLFRKSGSADLSDTEVTEEQAEAFTSPNGSLYLTIADATGGDGEAIGAVGECRDYFVGKRWP